MLKRCTSLLLVLVMLFSLLLPASASDAEVLAAEEPVEEVATAEEMEGESSADDSSQATSLPGLEGVGENESDSAGEEGESAYDQSKVDDFIDLYLTPAEVSYPFDDLLAELARKAALIEDEEEQAVYLAENTPHIFCEVTTENYQQILDGKDRALELTEDEMEAVNAAVRLAYLEINPDKVAEMTEEELDSFELGWAELLTAALGFADAAEQAESSSAEPDENETAEIEEETVQLNDTSKEPAEETAGETGAAFNTGDETPDSDSPAEDFLDEDEYSALVYINEWMVVGDDTFPFGVESESSLRSNISGDDPIEELYFAIDAWRELSDGAKDLANELVLDYLRQVVFVPCNIPAILVLINAAAYDTGVIDEDTYNANAEELEPQVVTEASGAELDYDTSLVDPVDMPEEYKYDTDMYYAAEMYRVTIDGTEINMVLAFSDDGVSVLDYDYDPDAEEAESSEETVIEETEEASEDGGVLNNAIDLIESAASSLLDGLFMATPAAADDVSDSYDYDAETDTDYSTSSGTAYGTCVIDSSYAMKAYPALDLWYTDAQGTWHHATDSVAYVHWIGGDVVYCIDPDKSTPTGLSSSYYNYSWRYRLSENQRKAIALMLAYGYPAGPDCGNDYNGAIATQILIWEIVTGCVSATWPYAAYHNTSAIKEHFTDNTWWDEMNVGGVYDKIYNRYRYHGMIPSYSYSTLSSAMSNMKVMEETYSNPDSGLDGWYKVSYTNTSATTGGYYLAQNPDWLGKYSYTAYGRNDGDSSWTKLNTDSTLYSSTQVYYTRSGNDIDFYFNADASGYDWIKIEVKTPSIASDNLYVQVWGSTSSSSSSQSMVEYVSGGGSTNTYAFMYLQGNPAYTVEVYKTTDAALTAVSEDKYGYDLNYEASALGGSTFQLYYAATDANGNIQYETVGGVSVPKIATGTMTVNGQKVDKSQPIRLNSDSSAVSAVTTSAANKNGGYIAFEDLPKEDDNGNELRNYVLVETRTTSPYTATDGAIAGSTVRTAVTIAEGAKSAAAYIEDTATPVDVKLYKTDATTGKSLTLDELKATRFGLYAMYDIYDVYGRKVISADTLIDEISVRNPDVEILSDSSGYYYHYPRAGADKIYLEAFYIKEIEAEEHYELNENFCAEYDITDNGTSRTASAFVSTAGDYTRYFSTTCTNQHKVNLKITKYIDTLVSGATTSRVSRVLPYLPSQHTLLGGELSLNWTAYTAEDVTIAGSTASVSMDETTFSTSSNVRMSGVTFEIYKAKQVSAGTEGAVSGNGKYWVEDGDAVQTAVTDENGEVRFDDLMTGDYIFEEKTGYAISNGVAVSSKRYFSARTGSDSSNNLVYEFSQDFLNTTHKAYIEFRKYDAETGTGKAADGSAMGEAVFGLYAAEDIYPTGDTVRNSSTLLVAQGTRIATSTATWSDTDNCYIYRFYYNGADGTGADGSGAYIPAGKYEIIEEYAPKYYKRDQVAHSVVIDSGRTETFEAVSGTVSVICASAEDFSDTPAALTGIQVEKVATDAIVGGRKSATSTSLTLGEAGIGGVQFGIYEVTECASTAAGAVYDAATNKYYKPSSSTPLNTVTTSAAGDSLGMASFGGLQVSHTYIIKELSSPLPYSTYVGAWIDGEKVENSTLNGVVVHTKSAAGLVSVRFEDCGTDTVLEIHKKDAATNTAIDITGAVFSVVFDEDVYDVYGNRIASQGDIYRTVKANAGSVEEKTDSDGRIYYSVNLGTFPRVKLAVRETKAPAGYEVAEGLTYQEETIVSSAGVVSSLTDESIAPTAEDAEPTIIKSFTVSDQPKTAQLTIVKRSSVNAVAVDEIYTNAITYDLRYGAPESGAVFTLYRVKQDANGNPVQLSNGLYDIETYAVADPDGIRYENVEVGTKESAQTGKITFKDLRAGYYLLVENSANAGFDAVDAENVIAESVSDSRFAGKAVWLVDMTDISEDQNLSITDTYTGMEVDIYKKDQAGNPIDIDGAQFTLYAAEGTETDTSFGRILSEGDFICRVIDPDDFSEAAPAEPDYTGKSQAEINVLKAQYEQAVLEYQSTADLISQYAEAGITITKVTDSTNGGRSYYHVVMAYQPVISMYATEDVAPDGFDIAGEQEHSTLPVSRSTVFQDKEDAEGVRIVFNFNDYTQMNLTVTKTVDTVAVSVDEQTDTGVSFNRESNYPLADAEFALYYAVLDDDGNVRHVNDDPDAGYMYDASSPVAAGGTDEDGRWTVTGLSQGRYILVETGVEGVYANVREDENIVITDNGVEGVVSVVSSDGSTDVYVSRSDMTDRAYFTIKKLDKTTGNIIDSTDAVFGLYAAEDIEMPEGTLEEGTLVAVSQSTASILAPEDTWFTRQSSVAKSSVRSITFSASAPSSYTSSWDASEKEDGSVTAYFGSGTVTLVPAAGQVYANQDSGGAFRYFSALTSFSTNGIYNTGSAYDMSYMFSGDSALTTLDLSSFNTQNVTDMSYMFTGDSGLTSLNVSSFNTINVTNMSDMFSDVSKLTSLDVSSFDTRNVTDMFDMFYAVGSSAGSTSINLGSSFDTSSVTNMSYMFASTSVSTLNLGSSFDTSSVTDMSSMFSGMSKVTDIVLGSHFDTSSATNMSYMFSGDNNLTGIRRNSADAAGSTTGITAMTVGSATDTGYMFRNCYAITELDLSGFKNLGVSGKNVSMFANMRHLEQVTVPAGRTFISGGLLPAPSATYITAPAGCQVTGQWFDTVSGIGYSPANVHTVNTSEVRTYVAWGDLTPKMLDGTNWWTAKDTASRQLSGAGVLTGLAKSDIKSITFLSGGTVPSSAAASWDVSVSGNQTVKAYLDANSDGGYDLVITGNGETETILVSNTAYENGTNTGTVTLSYFLSGFTNCKTITGLDKLDTGHAVSAVSMFYNDTALTKIKSSSGTVNVLTFNTGNVKSFNGMFRNCSALTGTLNVSGLNSSLVTDMSYMFRGCSGLTGITAPANTANVTDMTQMFYGCRTLTALNISGFTSTSLKTVNAMFCDCSSLTALTLPEAFTCSGVTDFAWMFSDCGSLISLDLHNISLSNAASLAGMFFKDTSLTTVTFNGSSSKTGSALTNLYDMFYNCSSLTTVKNGSSSTRANVVDMTGFNTSAVTDMSYMFSGCSSVSKLDIRAISTACVTTMQNMFSGMNKLEEVAVGSAFAFAGTSGYFPTPTTGTGYLSEKSGYVVNGKWYNQSTLAAYAPAAVPNNTAATYSAYNPIPVLGNNWYSRSTSGYEKDSLTKITFMDSYTPTSYTEKWDASYTGNGQVTAYRTGSELIIAGNGYGSILAQSDMSGAFSGLTNLTAIVDADVLDMSGVTNASRLFAGLHSLTSTANLDGILSWDMSSVTTMAGMFDEARACTVIDLNGWDTSSLTDMSGIFCGSADGGTVDITSWNTGKVTNAANAFMDSGAYKITVGAKFSSNGSGSAAITFPGHYSASMSSGIKNKFGSQYVCNGSWYRQGTNTKYTVGSSNGANTWVCYRQPYVTGVTVTTAPDKTNYNYGDSFDPTGMVLTFIWDDGTSSTLTWTSASTKTGAWSSGADYYGSAWNYAGYGMTSTPSGQITTHGTVTTTASADTEVSSVTLNPMVSVKLPGGSSGSISTFSASGSVRVYRVLTDLQITTEAKYNSGDSWYYLPDVTLSASTGIRNSTAYTPTGTVAYDSTNLVVTAYYADGASAVVTSNSRLYKELNTGGISTVKWATTMCGITFHQKSVNSAGNVVDVYDSTGYKIGTAAYYDTPTHDTSGGSYGTYISSVGSYLYFDTDYTQINFYLSNTGYLKPYAIVDGWAKWGTSPSSWKSHQVSMGAAWYYNLPSSASDYVYWGSIVSSIAQGTAMTSGKWYPYIKDWSASSSTTSLGASYTKSGSWKEGMATETTSGTLYIRIYVNQGSSTCDYQHYEDYMTLTQQYPATGVHWPTDDELTAFAEGLIPSGGTVAGKNVLYAPISKNAYMGRQIKYRLYKGAMAKAADAENETGTVSGTAAEDEGTAENEITESAGPVTVAAETAEGEKTALTAETMLLESVNVAAGDGSTMVSDFDLQSTGGYYSILYLSGKGETLPAGRYYVKELQAPGGYLADTDPVYIDVLEDGTVSVFDEVTGTETDPENYSMTFSDTPENNTITIRKTASSLPVGYSGNAVVTETNSPVNGVTFTVYEAALNSSGEAYKSGNLYVTTGSAVATFSSDTMNGEDGLAQVTGLESGKIYVVRETRSPAMTQPNVSVYEQLADFRNTDHVELNWNDPVRRCDLVVTKKNAFTGTTLTDEVAAFRLIAAEYIYNLKGDIAAKPGDVVLTGTTVNGVCTFSNIIPGKYYVQETGITGDYTVNSEKYEVTVKGAESVSSYTSLTSAITTGLTVEDSPYVQVRVLKTDMNGNALSGAGFTLAALDAVTIRGTTYNPEQPIATAVSGADGYAVFTVKLPIGENGGVFKVYESSAPEGYQLLDSTEAFSTIYSGMDEIKELFTSGDPVYSVENGIPTITYTVEDPKSGCGTIKIVKTGKALTDFTSVSDGSVSLVWTSEALGGITFNVYTKAQYDANKNNLSAITAYATLTTDENGMARLTDIPYGTYYITEAEAPEGRLKVCPDNYAGYPSMIQEENFNGVMEVTLSGENYSNPVQQVEFDNVPILVDAKIYKIDAATKLPVKGATFAIYSSSAITVNGKTIPAGTYLETVTSDENGLVQFSPYLPFGYTYCIKEIAAPEGYLLSGEIFSFTPDYSRVNEDTGAYEYEATCEDYAKSGVTLIKYTSQGASGMSTEENGSKVTSVITYDTKQSLSGAKFSLYKSGSSVPLYTNLEVNEYGILSVTGLADGDYYFVETSAPDGYKLDTAQHSFTISSAAGLAVTTQPSTTDYLVGSDFDDAGMVVTYTEVNGNTKTLTSGEYTIDGGTDMPWETTYVTVCYVDKTANTSFTTQVPVRMYVTDALDTTGKSLQVVPTSGVRMYAYTTQQFYAAKLYNDGYVENLYVKPTVRLSKTISSSTYSSASLTYYGYANTSVGGTTIQGSGGYTLKYSVSSASSSITQQLENSYSVTGYYGGKTYTSSCFFRGTVSGYSKSITGSVSGTLFSGYTFYTPLTSATVQNTSSVAVEVDNEPILTRIEFTKVLYDATQKEDEYKGEEPLAGAVFELYAEEDVTIGGLTIPEGCLIARDVSDENGVVDFDGIALPYGCTFRVKETDPETWPEARDDIDESWEKNDFVFTTVKGTTVDKSGNKSVVSADTDNTLVVTLISADSKTGSVYNEYKEQHNWGRIIIEKTDETGERLAGAVFQLEYSTDYDPENPEDATWTVVVDSYASYRDVVNNVSAPYEGTTYDEMNEPDGINYHGDDYDDPEYQTILNNNGKDITKEDGSLVYDYLYMPDPRIEGNPTVTYRVREIEAPEGYRIDEEQYPDGVVFLSQIPAIVKHESGTETLKYNFNVKVVNPTALGSIEVTKMDIQGDLVSGVSYELDWSADDGATWSAVTYRDEDDAVTAGTTTAAALEESGILTTTDSCNPVLFDGLLADGKTKYRLTEVRTVNGMSLLTETIFEDYLPLMDESGDYIKDEDGKLIADISFVITNTSVTALPETGGSGSFGWSCAASAALALTVAGAWMTIRKRKKNW